MDERDGRTGLRRKTLESTGLRAFRADLAAARAYTGGRIVSLIFPELFAVACYRLSRSLRAARLVPAARLIGKLGQALTGAEISPLAVVQGGLLLVHTGGVVIGPRTVAGHGLTLYGGVVLGDSHTKERSGFPVLADRVTLFTKSSVLGPVQIGDDALVGAHALCMIDVPAGATAVGIPARILPLASDPDGTDQTQ